MRITSRLSALAALSLTAGLALSACSSGSTPSASETTPEASTESSATSSPSASESNGGSTAEFAEGSTMAKLAEAGSITVGTKFDQPLFGLVGEDGKPQGFDVEIAKLIASKLGISEDNINWVETVSANREPFIESGQVDIVVATYTINDKRKEVISFAGPYYIAGQDILVLAGNPEGITGIDDLKGKDVCSVSGSTSEQNLADAGVNVIATDTYSACLEPLRQGSVVAVSTDNVILAGLAAQNEGEFEVVGNPFTSEPYGIGLKKDDDEFRSFINDVLEESYEDGAWAAAWEKTAGTVLATPEPPAVDRY